MPVWKQLVCLVLIVTGISAPALAAETVGCPGSVDHVTVQETGNEFSAYVWVPDQGAYGDRSSPQIWDHINQREDWPALEVLCYASEDDENPLRVAIPYKFKTCVFEHNRFSCH